MKDQPVGKEAYQRLSQALAESENTYTGFNNRLRKSNPPIAEGLAFIQQDRGRLVSLLRDLQSKSNNDQAIYWLIEHTLDKMTNRNPQKRGDDSQLAAISEKFGHLRWRAMADGGPQWDYYEGIVRNYFMRNYSFMSEMMTAFELRGLTSSGDLVNQMMSREAYSVLKRKLDRRNIPNFEGLELDAVTMDNNRGVMTWFEVKHVNKRIEVDNQHWYDSIRKRYNQLRELKNIIERDPTLRADFAPKIQIRFVIRGAGISEDARRRIRRNIGVEVESGSPEEFNQQFGRGGR